MKHTIIDKHIPVGSSKINKKGDESTGDTCHEGVEDERERDKKQEYPRLEMISSHRRGLPSSLSASVASPSLSRCRPR